VAFDSWYAGLPNLKKIRSFNWTWLTRLKENRQVNPDRQGLSAISQVEIGRDGRIVWLEGYGLIRVFKIVITEDDIEYWATNDLEMSELGRVKWAGFAWTIESVPQAHRKEVQDELTDCVQAVREMKGGPSESAFRGRLQTTPSCCG
jgi:hypothetical protein